MKEQIREIREALGLKQKQLAFLLDVTKGSICQWEREYHEPVGGNKQLIRVLWSAIQKRTPNELKQIGEFVIGVGLKSSPGAAIVDLLELLYLVED